VVETVVQLVVEDVIYEPRHLSQLVDAVERTKVVNVLERVDRNDLHMCVA
jgi:hypothetical protein